VKQYQLAVIGAGPAGMAAATEASRQGLSVIVLDEQAQPGGQIYRAIEQASPQRLAVLGADYAKGSALAAGFRASGADYLPSTLLWNAEHKDGHFLLDLSTGAGSRRISASRLLVATGAVERPVPVPGWTLPGVTTAGALQILLKAHGGVAQGAVLAGAGPLLLLLAQQMIAAGVAPRAVVEIGPANRLRRALPFLPRALAGWRYLVKGAGMLRALRQAGVAWYQGASGFWIEGSGEATAVHFEIAGEAHRIECSQVALHMGVVPNPQLTRMLRCEHDWHPTQQAFVPRTDVFFETSEAGVFVAGDGAGIGGAASAALRGQLVALRIAALEGVRGAEARIPAIRRRLKRDAAVRPFLEALYAPAEEVLNPADTTLVCRCEEVTAGAIRQAVAGGAPGPNQLKAFLRCGMGPCQGRTCGPAVTALVARTRGVSEAEAGYFRIRPPLKPLPLSELADIAED
jgi:NADPH-dependent 2,4-dienoyl-CoA reductase/sulfur reductase-like enzyme